MSATPNYYEKFPDNRRQGNTDLRKAQLVMLRMLKITDDICKRHKIPYWLEAGTLLGAIRHKGFIPWDDDLDISMLRADYERFIEVAKQELPDNIFLQNNETDPHYFNRGCPLKLRDKESILLEKHDELDDKFQQGIFLDIFPYDNITTNPLARNISVYTSKKILKMMRAKIWSRAIGKSYNRHRSTSKLFSLPLLKRTLNFIIKRANKKSLPTIGYGYDYTPKLNYQRETIFPLTRVTFEDAEFCAPGQYDQFLTIKYGDYMELPPEHERTHAQHAKVLKPILE